MSQSRLISYTLYCWSLLTAGATAAMLQKCEAASVLREYQLCLQCECAQAVRRQLQQQQRIAVVAAAAALCSSSNAVRIEQQQ
jgi:hypothetical protein